MKRTRLALSFLEFSSVLGCCQWISTPSISRSSIIRATPPTIEWTEESAEKSRADTASERTRRIRPPFREPLIVFKYATISVNDKKKRKGVNDATLSVVSTFSVHELDKSPGPRRRPFLASYKVTLISCRDTLFILNRESLDLSRRWCNRYLTNNNLFARTRNWITFVQRKVRTVLRDIHDGWHD